ncbi:alpha/beta fold hydrolase [Pseudobacter ginsenosidimutans]|jgi:pimeloyl-ACP methyl ester carboxylesterase|uniref:Pimeloyl-ACP methyl ester carboxylesterase n=1 Tax=Pseudobacter ginsenosidimutans TaxID=661488 RepID=A0A4Q7MVE4_9BACT|nr:alpha/beta hydrolase [Pseudobacter ginsenosidimutans]QEC41260.1 alpha/beta hydrolase [Pseudobacter ginsenosidimutans]RZS71964.1 pimeloyl-ACP methyl ester carboxylesterase [Pseudobacter ginsenosidimutans]
MQSAILLYKQSSVHYRYGGKGSQLLLCLHGYGETANSFDFLETHLGSAYSIIAIDLPFHGLTQWKEGLDFKVQDLTVIVRAILTARGWSSDAAFTLMGFSMGGRAALSLLQALPQQVQRLVLLAPDGLKVNRWYWLATQTLIGNGLFRFTMHYPGWFFFILNTGNKLKLINQSIYKFTRYYIHDAAIRKELYNRWICMRHITPDLKIIRDAVRQYKIPVRLLYGKYDRIILTQPAERFRKGIEEWCTISILPAGHQVLQEKHIDAIAESLRV